MVSILFYHLVHIYSTIAFGMLPITCIAIKVISRLFFLLHFLRGEQTIVDTRFC